MDTLKISSSAQITKATALLGLCLMLGALCATSARAALNVGSFTTDLSVSQPALTSPADGATLAFPDDGIALRWTDIGGATKYEVQLASLVAPNVTCSFANDTIIDTTTTTDSYVPTLTDAASSKLYATGTFCWRVRATDGTSPGTWSVASSFSRNWAANLTGLAFYNNTDGAMPRPDGGAASSTTPLSGYLGWNPVPGASAYDIEVAPQTTGFSQDSTVLTSTNHPGTRVLLPHLPSATYLWRVRAHSGTNSATGDWTYGNPFSVAWTTMSGAPADVSPPNGSTQSDIQMGWTPVPGASYYQFQAASDPGCFWNPNSTDEPKLYGSWGADGYYSTGPSDDGTEFPSASMSPYTSPFTPWLYPGVGPGAVHGAAYCRLTDDGATSQTINNWATFNMFDESAFTGTINVPGRTDVNGNCVASPFPIFQGDTKYCVLIENVPVELPPKIYWRVRPVSQISQATETGWTVSGNINVYGKWIDIQAGGTTTYPGYTWDPSTTVTTGDGTRCSDAANPTGSKCLIQKPAQLTAQASSPQNSASMQIPLLSWKPFGPSDLEGSYYVEIAQDPNFSNMVEEKLMDGGAWRQSYSPTYGFADNNTSGYYWRVIPCTWTIPNGGSASSASCAKDYAEAAVQLLDPSSGAQSGFRTFTKQVTMSVGQSQNFSDTSPILSWAPVDGADHYDVQLAQDPYFSSNAITLDTTGAAIVPMTAGASASATSKELSAGSWYWRVRAVDMNGIHSGWSLVNCSGSSPVGCFTERMPAPVITGPADGTSTAWPVVSWKAVDSAGQYEVQVASTSTFDQGTIKVDATTAQTSALASVPAGTWYWRVRAENGSANAGLWTDPSSFVSSGTGQLSYQLPAVPVVAGSKLAIDGTFTVDGAPSSGQAVTLLEKTGSCAAAGAYTPVGSGTSGSSGLQGQLELQLKADQIHCFRMQWKSGGQDRYSAPFQDSVTPLVTVLKWPTKKVTVATKKAFSPTVKFGKALSGKVTFQIMIGKTWTTLLTKNVVRTAATKVSLKVPKAGTYRARVSVTGTGVYADTTIALPTIKVRDQFAIKATAAKAAAAKKAAAKRG